MQKHSAGKTGLLLYLCCKFPKNKIFLQQAAAWKRIFVIRNLGHRIPARIPWERCTCEARANAVRTNPQGLESPLSAYAEGYSKEGRSSAIVREDLLRDNPFNKTDKRDKMREPESKREFLAIDEVKRMMKTPSNLFDGYVCCGIGGYCEDKRAAKSWSYNRQSHGRISGR